MIPALQGHLLLARVAPFAAGEPLPATLLKPARIGLIKGGPIDGLGQALSIVGQLDLIPIAIEGRKIGADDGSPCGQIFAQFQWIAGTDLGVVDKGQQTHLPVLGIGRQRVMGTGPQQMDIGEPLGGGDIGLDRANQHQIPVRQGGSRLCQQGDINPVAQAAVKSGNGAAGGKIRRPLSGGHKQLEIHTVAEGLAARMRSAFSTSRASQWAMA